MLLVVTFLLGVLLAIIYTTSLNTYDDEHTNDVLTTTLLLLA